MTHIKSQGEIHHIVQKDGVHALTALKRDSENPSDYVLWIEFCLGMEEESQFYPVGSCHQDGAGAWAVGITECRIDEVHVETHIVAVESSEKRAIESLWENRSVNQSLVGADNV